MCKKVQNKSLSYVLSPMVVIVNITGQNNGKNSDQNFNLIATINWAAAIYENNSIRQISGKNCGEKSGKNYSLNSG